MPNRKCRAGEKILENKINSNQIKSNQIKSNQIKSNQIKRVNPMPGFYFYENLIYLFSFFIIFNNIPLDNF